MSPVFLFLLYILEDTVAFRWWWALLRRLIPHRDNQMTLSNAMPRSPAIQMAFTMWVCDELLVSTTLAFVSFHLLRVCKFVGNAPCRLLDWRNGLTMHSELSGLRPSHSGWMADEFQEFTKLCLWNDRIGGDMRCDAMWLFFFYWKNSSAPWIRLPT